MLAAGFVDPVAEAQGVFHAVMRALSRPGSLQELDVALRAPLRADMAGVALALCDHETPVWLDPALPRGEATAGYLAFHAGCPLTTERQAAAFAFVAEAGNLPSFDDFALGSDAYPDRSTTVVAAVAGFERGRSWRATGPGIDGTIAFTVDGLPDDFAPRWAANHALFPRGIDLLLLDGCRILALPRSVALSPIEEDVACM